MNDSDLCGTSSLATALQVLHHGRLKHSKNSMIGYLNVNSLRNKLTDLKVILKYLSLYYFVLSETKLGESFPNAQFTLDGYENRARRDRNKFVGGLIEYVRKGLICRGLPNMSRNPMSVYVLKLLSLRKSGSFSVSIDPQVPKI